MSRNNKHKPSFSERILTFLITALCICAVILVGAIVIQNRFLSGRENLVADVVISDTTSAPIQISAHTESSPDENDADATPSPAPTTEPVNFEFLPVYSKGNPDKKAIAILLDECSYFESVQYVVDLCVERGAKLTLFPFGSVVMGAQMSELLTKCVMEYGFEIENRTWSNGLVYSMSADAMAAEIWKSDIAVDYMLNADYGMHLIRFKGNYGTNDARTHAYLKQLHYDGIVVPTVDCTGKSIDKLKNKLEAGSIYKFTSSKEDTALLEDFLGYALSCGYKCVTLNEVLGFSGNTVTAVDASEIISQSMPVLTGYTDVYTTYENGDHAWQILRIQNRLIELGYLVGNADGIFGATTATALGEFQVDCGMLGTSVADQHTQERLFAEDAPRRGTGQAVTAKYTPIPAK